MPFVDQEISAPVSCHERVRELLLDHLKLIDRAAQTQADEPLRQACADFAAHIAKLPAEPALNPSSP